MTFSRDHLDAISQLTGERGPARQRREEYLALSNDLPMPSPKEEAWRYADVSGIDLTRFERADSQQGITIARNGLLANRGVIFTDLRSAMREHRKIFDKYFMKRAAAHTDKFTALHDAMWDGGVFVFVPRNVKLDMPLRTTHKVGRRSAIFTRTLIILEEGASMRYYEEHTSDKRVSHALRCDAVEVYLEGNSRLSFNSFQDWGLNVTSVSSWMADAGRDAEMTWNFAQIGGSFSRIRIDTHFSGEGSSSRNRGIYFGGHGQRFDITTNAHHHARNTSSDILVKGALSEDARSVYRGLIKIDEEAKGTNSYLSNHNLMLSDEAVANTIPSLTIDTDDVKASHGATLGKLDKEQLFYMMTRGIRRKDAENALIGAFLREVTDKIDDSRFRIKLEKKMEGKVTG